MTSDDNGRPIGTSPITDAASATAPEDLPRENAAMTATGEDVDNDHADERPIDRSQDAAAQIVADGESEADMLQQSGSETDAVDEHGHKPRDQQFTPVE